TPAWSRSARPTRPSPASTPSPGTTPATAAPPGRPRTPTSTPASCYPAFSSRRPPGGCRDHHRPLCVRPRAQDRRHLRLVEALPAVRRQVELADPPGQQREEEPRLPPAVRDVRVPQQQARHLRRDPATVPGPAGAGRREEPVRPVRVPVRVRLVEAERIPPLL